MIEWGVIAVFVVAYIVVFCVGVLTGVAMVAAYLGKVARMAAKQQSKGLPGDEWKEGKQPEKDNDWLRRILGNDDKDPEAK